jgi:hypothetical protein
MKSIFILIFTFPLLSWGQFDANSLKGHAKNVPKSLGLKEGKVKKIGGQFFMLYKGDLYHLTPTDPSEIQKLQSQLK